MSLEWILLGFVVLVVLLACIPGARNEKLWSIGGHQVAKRTNTRKHHHGYNIHKKETYFVCVDCEKKFKERAKFKGEECYDLVES